MTIGILERASGLFSGQSRATSIAGDPLPITRILRNPRRILLVPGPHIEDILLVEPFARAIKERRPDTYLALVFPPRLVPLPAGLACFDRIFPCEFDGMRANSKEAGDIGSALAAEGFDVAIALSYEAESGVGRVASVSGAKLTVGSEGLEGDDVTFHVVTRETACDGSYREMMGWLFSLIGVKAPAQFTSRLLKRQEGGTSLSACRVHSEEPATGFFFDQLDPLDVLRWDELERVTRTIARRREGRSLLAGFGLKEKDTRSLRSDGVEVMEEVPITDLARSFALFSWTVTNSLGFALLLGGRGARAILLSKPSRLRKYPIREIASVTFLPVVSGRILLESLVRIMEGRYAGE